ncbi:MAG TPA: lipoprotein-releasing ABC transporter permease subunit [Steroidobacteraceae bacterium]|jgi:lipoprotein-releasing system permease protein|nr:lipoprotein-releasing ABC transporter permease subunit [Steroidobacteraceae bacterium]
MKRYWYEGFIGFRYLRASPRRGFVSLIAGIAIAGLALGVAVLIVVLSVMNGFEEVLRTRILSLTAHATISGIEGRISNWRADLGKLQVFPGIDGVAPYIEEQGLLTHGDKSSGVLLRGILPQGESRVLDLSSHLQSGRLADLSAGSYRIILGKALAGELGVKVGDRVVLIVALGDVTPLGVIPRMRAFEVAGILSVGMYEYDRRIALVAMQDAAKLLRMGDDVTGLRLKLADMYAAPRVSRAAAVAIGGGVEIQDWTNEHVNFFRSITITKRILFVILSLMVAVAAFNIVSTMVMVVKDKRRDIAILRTFGSSPRSILSVFIVQGSLIGMLGILIGVAIGVVVAVNLQGLVHALEAVVGFKFLDARVYYMSDLPAHVRVSDVLRICGFAFVLACVSTIYPAVRAARLLPAESLRND